MYIACGLYGPIDEGRYLFAEIAPLDDRLRRSHLCPLHLEAYSDWIINKCQISDCWDMGTALHHNDQAARLFPHHAMGRLSTFKSTNTTTPAVSSPAESAPIKFHSAPETNTPVQKPKDRRSPTGDASGDFFDGDSKWQREAWGGVVCGPKGEVRPKMQIRYYHSFR